MNIEVIQPTNSELLLVKQSRMLNIEATLKDDDYKHTRHLREKQLNRRTTLTEEQYTKLCYDQQVIVDEYNQLEVECKELELLIKHEQEEQLTSGTI